MMHSHSHVHSLTTLKRNLFMIITFEESCKYCFHVTSISKQSYLAIVDMRHKILCMIIKKKDDKKIDFLNIQASFIPISFFCHF